MSLMPGPAFQKIQETAYKDKLRKQMHHDLCVLCAGGANSPKSVTGVASEAMNLYKELWLQVMKEIP